MADFEQSALDLGNGFRNPDEVTPAGKRPPGRPRGTKGKFRSQLDKAFRMRWHEAFEKLMQGVLNGEPIATRIYWERVYPRPQHMTVMLENMPEVKSPADVRAAMHALLGRVAAGEITAEEGAALVGIMKDILQAHTMQAVMSGAVVQTETSSARDLFAERLARVIEARKAKQIDGPKAPAAAPEMSEEELAAKVLEAVERKLNGQ